MVTAWNLPRWPVGVCCATFLSPSSGAGKRQRWTGVRLSMSGPGSFRCEHRECGGGKVFGALAGASRRQGLTGGARASAFSLEVRCRQERSFLVAGYGAERSSAVGAGRRSAGSVRGYEAIEGRTRIVESGGQRGGGAVGSGVGCDRCGDCCRRDGAGLGGWCRRGVAVRSDVPLSGVCPSHVHRAGPAAADANRWVELVVGRCRCEGSMPDAAALRGEARCRARPPRTVRGRARSWFRCSSGRGRCVRRRRRG